MLVHQRHYASVLLLDRRNGLDICRPGRGACWRACARSGPGRGRGRQHRLGQCSGANRAVKCRSCWGWDTMRMPGSWAARLATRVTTSIT